MYRADGSDIPLPWDRPCLTESGNLSTTCIICKVSRSDTTRNMNKWKVWNTIMQLLQYSLYENNVFCNCVRKIIITIRNHLIYDETNLSQIAEKTSQNSIYDGFVMISNNFMYWASQIKSSDVFFVVIVTDWHDLLRL